MGMIVLIFAFTILLFFPLLGGYVAYKKNNSQTLVIKQDRSKNPRYFADTFIKLFEEKWINYDGSGKLKFSHEESIIEADKTALYKSKCDCVVYAEKIDFNPEPTGIQFYKEIYVKKNAYLRGVIQLRAIACLNNVLIGENTEIIRWADAQNELIVLDNCDLGISTTSGNELIIGINCLFRRLYAPVIYIGQKPQQKWSAYYTIDKKILYLVPKTETKRNLKYIDKFLINESGIAEFSVVSKRNVTVVENIIVQGSIRSHKGIRICDGVIVCGNLFAEGNIVLGKNVCVLGSIFTQGDIIVESRVMIGQKNKIVSIVARGRIEFSENSVVYGNVSCEGGGKISKWLE